jgi:hypothetical protein
MTQTTKPDKQLVRDVLKQQREERTPPPSPERIRELLGWNLIEAEREQLARQG